MSGPMGVTAHRVAAAPQRRVRHGVRDGIAVMVFSLTCSVVVAFLLGTLMRAVGN